ncbi:RNA-binding protein 45 isoform X1 [Aquila chrysaetos chrysaetos]|uniref:RNA binding motif protein 45 n=1 Tax=Aquila chrysaetos chrysaetos TaxID=223781 RepID=A0A663DZP9_AQUCH|nr:RNA-binding protein 45 isoform X1 [Aquila chrysaetos chrysaetos]XP_029874364.1 RNA-binding protein 45 isoform X1 [Aquila chrysaetos chrysaetos]
MLSPRRKGRCGRSPPAPEKSQRSPAAREPGGPAMEEGSGFRLSAECLDEPPNSRVFVVLGKDTGEALIRERFAPFGDIQNIWLLRDKRTNESRGIAFIKFARSSQACRAMEEMHGRSLVPDTKPIKVFIAQSRASGSHRDVEDEELTRIFVMIPKSYTEEDLREKFKMYGDIEYCSIIKNKTTGESKGLGYVRYLKPSQAARAIEECDRSYRAILAEPKNKSSESFEHDYYSNNTRQEPRGNTLPFCGQPEFCSFEKNETRIQESVSKRLSVVSRLPFIQEQLFALFDLVPGLEYCDVQRDPHTNSGYAVIQYSTAASAIYAKYKLHGFEYPPGNRLTVIFLEDGSDSSDLIRKMATQLVTAHVSSVLRNNNAVVQQYRTPPQAFGGTSGSQLLQPQTDAILPPHKKKVPPDTSVKERLFILFHPHPLPVNVLEDVFCRFGHLIKVYLVAGKNVGYAKFADRASASDAITALHGKIVNGVRLKVRLADSPTEESNKRQRTY